MVMGIPPNAILYGILLLVFVTLLNIIKEIFVFIIDNLKLIVFVTIVIYIISQMKNDIGLSVSKSSFLSELLSFVGAYSDYISNMFH